MKRTLTLKQAIRQILLTALAMTLSSPLFAKPATTVSKSDYVASLALSSECQVGQNGAGKRIDACVLSGQGFSQVTTTQEDGIYRGVALEGHLEVPVVVLIDQQIPAAKEIIRVDFHQELLAIKLNDAHRLIRSELIKQAVQIALRKRIELLERVQ